MGALIDEILARCTASTRYFAEVAVATICDRLGAAARIVGTDEVVARHLAPVSYGAFGASGPTATGAEALARDRVVVAAVEERHEVAVPIRCDGHTLGVLELRLEQPPSTAVTAELDGVGALVALLLSRDLERARAAHFEAIFDHIAHPIFVKDRAFRWVMVNQAFCDLVGRPREALLLRSDYDYFPKEQADFFRAKDREMFSARRTVEIDEEPITDAAGRLHLLATTKVPLFGPDGEVKLLVGIIHDISRIKEVEAELQAKNEELAQEVTERTVAAARLDALNRELEAFSYSVSHDLRAPLRIIDGFSKVVLEDHASGLDEQGRLYLERVRANAQRMGQLIDDILALSRVTRAELHMEPVDLSALAGEVVGRLRDLEPTREVKVEIDPRLRARGDSRLLTIVLENLIGNAWKFTGRKKKPRIEVGCALQAGERAFFVRDNGAGFEMTDANKLFRPFSRLHRPDEFAGTGVGLATVQRIVHRHGGRIWAEAAPGKGATFWFTLP